MRSQIKKEITLKSKNLIEKMTPFKRFNKKKNKITKIPISELFLGKIGEISVKVRKRDLI